MWVMCNTKNYTQKKVYGQLVCWAAFKWMKIMFRSEFVGPELSLSIWVWVTRVYKILISGSPVYKQQCRWNFTAQKHERSAVLEDACMRY